jgi:CRISPR-associated protein Cmr1
MTPLHYRMSFVGPASVGDADQAARWRTPPIKAQLRQWWRVAYAAGCGHRVDVDALRRAEARLFGAAGDGDGESGRSLVRLRLDRWDAGKLARQSWQPLARVSHPEVDRGKPTADLYLGYGPVTLRDGPLKGNAAFQPGEWARLAVGLMLPDGDADIDRLQHALQLMHRYGALGGRSRNAWGSFVLEPVDAAPAWPVEPDPGVLRPWREALTLDWAHAIGRDDLGPLVWTTGPKADWRAAMVDLAQLKIDLRVSLGFRAGKGAAVPEPRHWLAYPVTNHSVRDWGDARLPNTLRFKLRPSANGQVEGLVFHMPALPPPAFQPERHRQDIEALWHRVHEALDRRLRPADGRKAPR